MSDQYRDEKMDGGKAALIALGTILGVGAVGTAIGLGVWAVEENKKKQARKCKKKKKHGQHGNDHGHGSGHGGLGPGHVPPHGGIGGTQVCENNDPYNGKPFLNDTAPAALGTFSPFDRTTPYDIGAPDQSYDSDRMGNYDPFEDDEMDARRLMPAGGGWRGDASSCGDDDLDTTAFGRWGPKAKAFSDFISVGGSARYGINTRTKSPIGGVASLRDMLVGGAPVPLAKDAILFGDSSHRQDLVFEATGKYPDLGRC